MEFVMYYIVTIFSILYKLNTLNYKLNYKLQIAGFIEVYSVSSVISLNELPLLKFI